MKKILMSIAFAIFGCAVLQAATVEVISQISLAESSAKQQGSAPSIVVMEIENVAVPVKQGRWQKVKQWFDEATEQTEFEKGMQAIQEDVQENVSNLLVLEPTVQKVVQDLVQSQSWFNKMRCRQRTLTLTEKNILNIYKSFKKCVRDAHGMLVATTNLSEFITDEDDLPDVFKVYMQAANAKLDEARLLRSLLNAYVGLRKLEYRKWRYLPPIYGQLQEELNDEIDFYKKHLATYRANKNMNDLHEKIYNFNRQREQKLADARLAEYLIRDDVPFGNTHEKYRYAKPLLLVANARAFMNEQSKGE